MLIYIYVCVFFEASGLVGLADETHSLCVRSLVFETGCVKHRILCMLFCFFASCFVGGNSSAPCRLDLTLNHITSAGHCPTI